MPELNVHTVVEEAKVKKEAEDLSAVARLAEPSRDRWQKSK